MKFRYLLLALAAMASQGPIAQVAATPAPGAADRAALPAHAISVSQPADDDVCWVAPEWREDTTRQN